MKRMITLLVMTVFTVMISGCGGNPLQPAPVKAPVQQQPPAIPSVTTTTQSSAVPIDLAIDYAKPQPLTKTITANPRPVKNASEFPLYVITWGADIATVLAQQNNIFKSEGVNVRLQLENNFPQQAYACLTGETPYLRGTMGQISSAAELFHKNNVDLVVFVQLSWSRGDDTMVSRPGKTLNDIQSVGLQLWGPHMDYAANLLKNAGRLDNVKFQWFKELQLPTYDTRGKIVDPVSAFKKDGKLDAVMCIIPDALALTSGGQEGTGSEGSVKGAKVLVTTRTASKIIADVYAVRKDYYDTHMTEVGKMFRALMRGQEELTNLIRNKSTQQQQYQQLLKNAASTLFGSELAVQDVDAMLQGGVDMVGYPGNVEFFTGKTLAGKVNTRSLETLTTEIQTAFIGLGLIETKVVLKSAAYDFNALAKGLNATAGEPQQVFLPEKIQAQVASKVFSASWEEGTLFVVEITFLPNQTAFEESKYAKDFEEAMKKINTYGGALVTIEGHADPTGVTRAKAQGESQQDLDRRVQNIKNITLDRARAVYESLARYCTKKGFKVDESQFVPVGMGIDRPKFSNPQNEAEWAANRRVVFRIKQIEAEPDSFRPMQ